MMKAGLTRAFRTIPLMLIVVFFCPFAYGKIIYVDDDATGANDGTNWADAYIYLQDALADANSAEKPIEICVANGTYKPDQGRNQILGDQVASFHVINGVSLKGGYSGLMEVDPNKRDIELYESTLSGDLAANDVNIDSFNDIFDEPTFSDNSSYVVRSNYANQTAILDGFTITGGRRKSIGIERTDGGAGMINYSGNPIIRNCTFTRNIASQCGGGMLNMHESNPIIEDCTFISNYSSIGGGIYNSNSNPTLIRSKFMRNYSEHGGGGIGINNCALLESQQEHCLKLIGCIFDNNFALQNGGGLSNYESETILTDCTFLDNSAHQGGGMYNHSGNPNLINCQFISNSASQGGGMYNGSGSSKLNNCQFIRNNAQVTGGGLAGSDDANPLLINCIFIDNSSNRCGGGLAGNNSIYNCIMSGNTAVNDGGAIYGWGEVINCTVIGNKASGNGGGICTQGITTLINGIYHNNDALIGDEIYLGVRIPPVGRSGTILRIPSVTAVNYSNVRSGKEKVLLDTDCTLVWKPSNIDADPCFADPGYWADADDPNVAVEPNDPNAVWIDGDYHLKSQAGRWDPASQSWVQDDVTSPCIDAGDPNSPIGHEPFPNGDIINMGAYGGTEYASLSLSTAVANGVIIDQQLNAAGQGYTVVRLYGSYYEMGYAHGDLLADYIVRSVEETKELFGDLYGPLRTATAGYVWKPAEIEQELDGMVEALAERHPAASIDKLDLKVYNAIGDLLYACRSHTCWGRYVAAPTRTLSTRRLDFSTPIGSLNHHVLFVYVPDDGSTQWVNLGFPGMVTAAQGVNEFGTLVSLHDYNSWGADISSGRMPRMIACRYALTYLPSSDLSRQLSDVFAELQKYEIMTGTFLNYYAPEGHGGVMTCNPDRTGPDFYNLRTPQNVWHHGEAMITTNQWTNGNYTPPDEDFGADDYYNDETPKIHESHWSLVDPVDSQDGLQRLSVAYRGKGDMTIWADGRIDGIGRTPRLEYEWSELFGPYEDDYQYEQDEATRFSLALSAK